MNLEYKKQIDKEHKEPLESEIVRAVWFGKVACVGSQLGFDVWTHFVGTGSDIEVKIEDKKGKKIEKIKGKVFGDKFGGSLIVPEKAKEELTFTAKLSKHGLEKKSGPVRLIKVSNLRWGQEEARRGDSVKISADIEGMHEGSEVMVYIYEHDQDGAHDFITKFPVPVKDKKIETEWGYEYHEDTDDIPTEDELQPEGRKYNYPEYFFMLNIDACKVKSDLLRFKDWIKFGLRDAYGDPIKDAKFVVIYADGTKKEGRLDSNGKAKLEDVPPGPYKIDFPDIPEFKRI
jgi:hypothetical protein